jgi:hypothetical protein
VEDLLFAASKKLPGFARLGRWDTCPTWLVVITAIGIAGVVTHSPLPHHRTCGSAYGGSVRLS